MTFPASSVFGTSSCCCAGAEKENEEDRLDSTPKLPWEGSDRDYTYQELLGTLPTCGCTDFSKLQHAGDGDAGKKDWLMLC